MGGKVECYLDIASYYCYILFIQLQQNKELLKQNEIEIIIHPYMLGAINVGSGNRPPWTVPAKAEYGNHTTRRAAANVGLKNLTVPEGLMEKGKTVVPIRALTYIKSTFAPEVFKTTFAYFFHAFWTLEKIPITPPVLKEVLSEVPLRFHLDCFNSPSSPSHSPVSSSYSSPEKLFTPEQVDQIMHGIGTEAVKTEVKGRVDEALARGAFGAPWLWVTNHQGLSEPFWGSDVWNFVYEFLGAPYQKMQLLPPQNGSKL
ncbi:hypothetical protein F5B22DRAFT_622461 [Xylaria bambusicola]|uniref:uncharacterized protein n=1 Tax=Xylaria bambusicola TaxID=326684 RepID=UPI00200735E3|nr:uncharacterized protein F5B22DRAFT_622461 [Xylaria bambusicola]KAI0506730.1 hypothetical protein F5B22DRAFT_622461 [Xylaria bambusicola]